MSYMCVMIYMFNHSHMFENIPHIPSKHFSSRLVMHLSPKRCVPWGPWEDGSDL